MKNMAIHFTVDGKLKRVEPKNHHFSLKELQELVKGYIEIITLPDKSCFLVNENGKIDNFPVNENATEFWKEVFPIKKYPLNNDELIVGNALWLSEEELNED